MPKKLLIIGLAVLFAISVGVGIFGFTRVASLNKEIAGIKASSQPNNLQKFNESSALDSGEYQSVFLSSGIVYFGQITKTSSEYLVLSDIFYLNSSESIQPSVNHNDSQSLSLVKLGCELHGPRDVMYIPKNNVSFWENLKDDSQVVKAIKEWKDQNPRGQACLTSEG